jgi:hypothetical protein
MVFTWHGIGVWKKNCVYKDRHSYELQISALVSTHLIFFKNECEEKGKEEKRLMNEKVMKADEDREG